MQQRPNTSCCETACLEIPRPEAARPKKRWPSKTAIVASAILAVALAVPARAADSPTSTTAQSIGPSTGFPLPRYVSLKSDDVNLREGPSQSHATTWVFKRAGLPVEITAEFDIWRRVRDADGDEGWVIQSMLSGRRTAIVKPWAKGELLNMFATAEATSPLAARIQSGVIADVRRCDGTWCRLSGPGFDGWMRQTNLWGVYPNEKVN
jgi:SH3-like domain-containing protein